jgi:hypothetical protein
MNRQIEAHKAPMARAATKIGIRDAMMRTWLSAARMARNKNDKNLKNGPAPGCRPWKRRLITVKRLNNPIHLR